ncbi:hypothetical protein SteCoe_34102 [Stentor coeruleus]|uniref:Uncharacterized protein n=1 Tax=Stentor coeruleus TaxID=5963 RepID=A0A1R2AVN5_9CILI|nr:hypothetical protein SteCoe_34733 [Stentor coeruleus]OMJ68450.1 hypothetical protein SteCoe_34102 [Stentor coeruleus]
MKMVNDFFHKLGKVLEKKHIGKNEAVRMFSSKETWNLEDLISKIREFDQKITRKEIENMFVALSSDDFLSEQVVAKELKKAMKDSDSSSESSDISSPSEGEFVQEDIDIDKVNKLYELLTFKIKANNIGTDELTDIISQTLPGYSDGEKLSKLFLRKELRIEDGVDRNMIISSILAGKGKISNGQVLEVLIENCLRFCVCEIQSPVPDDLKSLFIDSCHKADLRKTGCLDWRVLEKIFEKYNIQVNLNVKYYCFTLGKSLEMIPYQLV